MVSPRHERISEVFLAVCELPAEERAKALHEQCADDPSLRSEVEALFAPRTRVPKRVAPALLPVETTLAPVRSQGLSLQ